MTTSRITLTQTHPSIPGRRNRYRERWALVAGRVFHVYAENLYGVWTVEDDTEHLAGAELLAFVQSPAYRVRIAMTLAEAREQIVELASTVIAGGNFYRLVDGELYVGPLDGAGDPVEADLVPFAFDELEPELVEAGRAIVEQLAGA